MGVRLRETLNFIASPRNDTFATEIKENLEKRSSVIFVKASRLGQRLSSGVGGGVRYSAVRKAIRAPEAAAPFS